MLLTILIPTRNRERRICPLVLSLLSHIDKRHEGNYEVLVLANKPDDNTVARLSEIKNSHLKIIETPQYYETSEENIFNGIHHAKGEYVWFLGDDDLPRWGAVNNLFDKVSNGHSDLYISNFRVIDEKGSVATQSQFRGVPNNWTGRLSDVVEAVGMINALSGWSIIVAKRIKLDVSVARKIAAISPIYSHCFWFLFLFSGSPVSVLQEPLVDYRVFHHAGWAAYTEKKGVSYFYYWHIGLLKLYMAAIQEGHLTANNVSKILETRHNGTKYRAIDEVVTKLIEQASVYIDTKVKRELLSREQFESIEWMIWTIDPGLQDALACVKKLYQFLWAPRSRNRKKGHDQDISSAREQAIAALNRREPDLYGNHFRYLYGGYSVFEKQGVWVGIRHDVTLSQDAIFTQFVPVAMPPGVLAEDNESALWREILKAPALPEPVGDRAFWTIRHYPVEGGSDVINGVESSGAQQDFTDQDLNEMVGTRSTA